MTREECSRTLPSHNVPSFTFQQYIDLDGSLQTAIDLLSIDPSSIRGEDNLAIQDFHSVSASELSIFMKQLTGLPGHMGATFEG